MPQALPRYLQLAETLTRDIAAGRLVDGERLPPEREMAAAMGLAVGTVRKALGELVARGMLTRVQGSGNYVRSGTEAAGIYALFRLELLSGGGLPTADILSVARLPKPTGAPDFGPATEAHRIRRLRRLDGDPAAIEEIWLDAAAAGPEPLRAKDLSESLYLHYRRALNLWIGAVSDRVGHGPRAGLGRAAVPSAAGRILRACGAAGLGPGWPAGGMVPDLVRQRARGLRRAAQVRR